MKTILLGFVIVAVVLGTGCQAHRGADDRVTDDDLVLREETRGPAYAVVALREVDRARLSGNVVILTSGSEPVYVRSTAIHAVATEDARNQLGHEEELLRSIKELRDSVQEQQAGAPE
ncbi:MAG: hypothetical protein PF961_10580 [Planctomycetota bacterium]|jgi:hypothetical protein|nr:hypothetical protein [Planctomycetota bacterium]